MDTFKGLAYEHGEGDVPGDDAAVIELEIHGFAGGTFGPDRGYFKRVDLLRGQGEGEEY